MEQTSANPGMWQGPVGEDAGLGGARQTWVSSADGHMAYPSLCLSGLICEGDKAWTCLAWHVADGE